MNGFFLASSTNKADASVLVRGLAILALGLGWARPAPAQEPPQYKRLGQEPMTAIVEGRFDEADRLLQAYEEDYPGDPEPYFVRAVRWSVSGDTSAALASARRAVALGLPPDRLLAGPRRLLTGLSATAGFRHWFDSLDVRLVHGPMLGRLRPDSASVWVRTARPSEVRIEVRDAGTGSAVTEARARTQEVRDFTTVLAFGGLEPRRRYLYRLWIDEKPESNVWTFQTPATAGEPGVVFLAFGGGAGYTPWHERMWHTVAAVDPLAFLFLGDNVYIDHPTLPDLQDYTYYRRQSRPEYRRFTGGTAVYAIWDDHDFTTNDQWGGPEVDDPPWKRQVWERFRNNWVNPAYGAGPDRPGCWFSVSLGDVDVFMLDGRYYREDPRSEAPRSMLGPTQKAWLLDALARSTATFKVIASPVPWAEGTKPGSLDTWDGYPEEREALFEFIASQAIPGVVLLSADRHRSDAWRIERPDAYDLFEFESSRLTNMHQHEVMPGSLFGYNEKNSFGTLLFDTARPDPEVTYRIHTIDGEVVYALTVAASDLTPRRP